MAPTPHTLWYLLAGALLVFIALTGSLLKRLPLSAALVYLVAGFALERLAVVHISPIQHAPVLEILTELAVVVSLFAAGLKLRLPLRHRAWRLPLRLASITMLASIFLLAAIGVATLGLPIGAAVLVAAALAPTDPVLASDVQVAHPTDTDRLRFGLTGEAGLNDGAAFPLVMLGLGLLGLRPLGPGGLHWAAEDVAWAISSGLGIGWVLGGGVARLVVHLRHRHREAVGLDDFLALGLVAAAYGTALAVHAYGFLAVFAAGLALRRVEARANGGAPHDTAAAVAARGENPATHPEAAPAYMASAVLGFTEALERIGELALMVLVGAMLSAVGPSWEGLGLAAALLLLVRPLAVAMTVGSALASPSQRALIGWFGVRGIGSLYYAFYALSHGLDRELGARLVRLVLTVVAVSAVLHGVSVTPLMDWYGRRRGRSRVGTTAADPASA